MVLRIDTLDRRQRRFLPGHTVDSVLLDILDRSRDIPGDGENILREGELGQRLGRASLRWWRARLLQWGEERRLVNPRRDSGCEWGL